jgi:hypothetical protein
MDDYVEGVLFGARDEYTAQLLSSMERSVMAWLDEAFAEASRLCLLNRQPLKYLQTMQLLMDGVKDWNAVALERETARALAQCAYLAELLSCVVVTTIKLLSCGRTTDRRKNIRVENPPLDKFVHRVYINVARQVRTYPYLFELVPDNLERTRRRHEREKLVRGCVLDTVRNGVGIPTEAILRAYLDESVENEEQVFIEPVAPPERDEAEAVENAKRLALGLEPLGGGGEGHGQEEHDAVAAMRRGPNPAELSGGGGGADDMETVVADADSLPVVSRVEFDPREEVHPIPARDNSDDNDDDEDGGGGGGGGGYETVDMNAGLVSIDDLF